MGKTIGYLRVSTADQDLDKNKMAILDFANQRDLGKVTFREETISTREHWQKRLIGEIVEDLEKEDILIVSEISRLGRSVLEVMTMLAILMEREVNFYVVKGNWQFDGSIQSKILATVFSLAAELERDFISQRTKEALRAKKAQGIKLGRPPGPGKSKLDVHKIDIEKLLNNGSTQRFIAHKFGTTPENLSIWMKKRGLKKLSFVESLEIDPAPKTNDAKTNNQSKDRQ